MHYTKRNVIYGPNYSILGWISVEHIDGVKLKSIQVRILPNDLMICGMHICK